MARAGIIRSLVFCLATAFAMVGGAVDFASGQSSSDRPTFKRVKPPAPGTKKRLIIQIERTWPYETDVAKKPGPVPQTGNSEDAQGVHDWFWKNVPHDLAGADPERIILALAALNSVPDEAAAIAPDTANMEKTFRNWGAKILAASAGRRVSPALVLAVMSVESAGKPKARSGKGAIGLMQLIPETAARFGVKNVEDPQQNIEGGVKYLDWLLNEFSGDPLMALAGYNAGENAVKSHEGVPPYAETRGYVPKVIAAWNRARLYCQSLPEYADDGCVFALNRSLGN